MGVRIGIDFRAALAHPCGIARYTRELSRGLLELQENLELILYAATRFGSVADRVPRAIREHPRATIIEWRLPARALKALAFLPGFSLKRVTGPLALLHHTDLTYLPCQQVPEIVTVHDLAFEVSQDFHGEDFRSEVGERVRQAVDRASLILVPSATTRADLINRYGAEEQRIRIVPHGVDHMLRRSEDTDSSNNLLLRPSVLETPYLLHVGTIEPRKNLVRLIRAYDQIRRRGAHLNLILAGPRGWMTESFDEALAASPYREDIYEIGPVPELTLRNLVRNAQMMVYPSLYEGYGLPIVEAMAMGTPVVTSNRSSTEEVAGGAACLVEPEDERSIANGIERVHSDASYRQQLSQLGQRRTAGQTWKQAARLTYDAYREVLLGHVEIPEKKRAAAATH